MCIILKGDFSKSFYETYDLIDLYDCIKVMPI